MRTGERDIEMNISQQPTVSEAFEDDFLKEFLDEFDFDNESNFMENSNSLLDDDAPINMYSNTPYVNIHPDTATCQSNPASFSPFEVS